MMIKVRVIIPALFAALVIVCGCGTAKRGDSVEKNGKRELTDNEKAGQIVFTNQCNQCHPNGEGGLGPALNNKPLPAAAIKLQVRKGGGRMPSFPPERISDTELDNLVKYVEYLRIKG